MRTERHIAALLLLGIAVIHAIETPSELDEVPYLGALFIALAVGSVLVALVLMRGSWSPAWGAGVTLAGLALIGYILSRTAGLPSADDDIGKWADPLGVASLIVEALMVAVGSGVLLGRTRGEQGRRPARRYTAAPTA